MENDPYQKHQAENEELFSKYRDSVPKKSLSAPRKSPPMIFSAARSVNPMDRGHSREQRDWVVNELEKIFHTYGNPVRKGSVEMESQLYDKSRNQEEYSALAQRLLRHMRDIAKRRQSRPLSNEPFSEEPISPTPSLSDKASAILSTSLPEQSIKPNTTPNPYFVSPRFPFMPIRPIPSPPQQSSLPPADIHYSTVRLPAPNKRTFAAATSGPLRTNPLTRFGNPDPIAVLEEVPEIITRLVKEDGEEPIDLELDPLSSDTYEVSFRFLVPRNAVIKQMTIHVKKTR